MSDSYSTSPDHYRGGFFRGAPKASTGGAGGGNPNHPGTPGQPGSSSLDIAKILQMIGTNNPYYSQISSFLNGLQGGSGGSGSGGSNNAGGWTFKPNPYDVPAPNVPANNPWLASLPQRDWMLQPTAPQNAQQAGLPPY